MDTTHDRRKNLVELSTARGYRTIELWQGDITDLPVDRLVVSAFDRDYSPTKTSIIGALDGLGIRVRALAEHPDPHDVAGMLGVRVGGRADGGTAQRRR